MPETLFCILSVCLIFAMGLSCFTICMTVILGYLWNMGKALDHMDAKVAQCVHVRDACVQAADRAEGAAAYVHQETAPQGEWEAPEDKGD